LIKSATATSLIVLLLALSPTASQAKSIKDQVSDTALAEYCGTVGVGTETNATITLPDGTTLTGTVECEAEDLVAGSDDSLDDALDDTESDDSEDDSSDDEGDDSGDDSSDDEGDDSGDDSSDDESDDSSDDSGDDSSDDEGDDSEDD
jgi:hypothetical protein